MKVIVLFVLCVIGGFAYAEPPVPRADQIMRQIQQQAPQPGHPGWQLEWNNQAPQQRQALDNFYQSLQQLQQIQQPVDRMQRQQHIEQLRDMSPQQRYEHFHDFVQDRALPTPSFQ